MGVALNSTNFSSITGQLNLRGCSKPLNPIIGDVYIDTEANELYLYTAIGWEPIGPCSEEKQHIIKKTRCSSCGALLPVKNVDNNGLCECKYCNTIEYVWE